MLTALIIGALIPMAPYTAQQDVVTNRLQIRVEQRREQRLQQNAPEVRLGKTIVPLRTSIRRLSRINETAIVLNVIDGSVLLVQRPDGTTTEVRVIGADAPEIVRSEQGIECYAREARDGLAKLVTRKEVQLTKSDYYRKDSFGRLLRYVKYSSQDLGSWLIWHGYAMSDRTARYEKQTSYNTLEDIAREENRGLWGRAVPAAAVVTEQRRVQAFRSHRDRGTDLPD
jgi:endonuclease YncB( thermonuclease family)